MRKKNLILTRGMLLIIVLGACSQGAATKDDDQSGNTKSDDSKKEKYKVMVNTKSNNSEFWQTVNAGDENAANEEDVELTLQARPSETDIAGQVSIVEDAVNQGVDAIVLAPSDVDALVSAVEKAENAGIPVVT